MTGFPKYGWSGVFDDPDRIWRNIDRLFGQVTERPFWPANAGVFPLVNITEDQESFFIQAEIPGMDPEGFHISATGRNLTIAGERKIITRGENVKYHRRERKDGKFSRIISMPADAVIDSLIISRKCWHQ
jgi:HSP20 family protein